MLEYARENPNTREFLPVRIILVAIVREKYTVIKVVDTWKMSVPGRTLLVIARMYIPITRIKVCQRCICSGPRHRTCVRDYEDNRWDDDLEASIIYNVHSPHLS